MQSKVIGFLAPELIDKKFNFIQKIKDLGDGVSVNLYTDSKNKQNHKIVAKVLETTDFLSLEQHLNSLIMHS